jgi:hypothetical protein
MAADLERLLREIRSLPPEDQCRLREKLEEQALLTIKEDESRGEGEFKRRLLRAGLLKQIKPPVTDVAPYRDRRPFEIQGKPLSETIIEERR